MLEQRLENAFDEAQDKVLETYDRLTVEVNTGLMEATGGASSRQPSAPDLHANQV